MPKLPLDLSGHDVRKAFERDGWTCDRVSGDHMVLTKAGCRPLVIPAWDVLPPFLLMGLLRTAGISRERFLALL